MAVSALTAHSKVVTRLYRSLFRLVGKLDKLVPPVGLPVLLATSPLPLGLPRFSPELSLRAVLTHHFRAAKAYKPGSEATEMLISDGMRALRVGNKRLASLSTHASALVALQSGRPAAVRYSVGQVVKHAKYSYKGVIVGWHETCRGSLEWQARNGVSASSASQPFYSVLVDIRDRPEAQVTYVAQDNLDVLSDAMPVEEHLKAASVGSCAVEQAEIDPTSRLVLHPLITKHFLEYRPAQGYYVPGEALAELYPYDVPSFAAGRLARALDTHALSLARDSEAVGNGSGSVGAEPPLPSPKSGGQKSFAE